MHFLFSSPYYFSLVDYHNIAAAIVNIYKHAACGRAPDAGESRRGGVEGEEADG
jgi:hypothetical protein